MRVSTPAICNVNSDRIIQLSIFFAISVFIFQAVVFKSASDDSDFAAMLNSHGVMDVLYGRYQSWSGRILIEFILLKTIRVPYFPQLMVVLCSWLLSYAIAKLASDKVQPIPVSFAAMVLICLASHSSNQAVFWITGAYNYLLPISIGLYSLSVILDKNATILKTSFSCILSVFACNNEQFGLTLVLIVSSLIAINIKLNRINWKHVVYLFFVITGVAIVLSAPGNANRAMTESLINMPFYYDMRLIDRFSIVVDRINGHLLYKNNYLILMCCIFSAFTMMKSKTGLVIRLPIILLSSFYVLFFIFNEYPNKWFANVLNINYSIFSDWSTPSVFISFAFTMSLLASFYISCMEKENNKLGITKVCLSFAVGVLSVAMIGFSPTAYASGTRIMFIFDLSIIFGLLRSYRTKEIK
nr:DUF6056 family protein [uncultured Enterobacter sp.]